MRSATRRRVVVDASVVVKWVVPEDYSEEASMLRDDHLEGVIEAHAPSIILAESASALRKYVSRGYVSAEWARKALGLLVESELKLAEIDSRLAIQSLEASMEYGITVYDALYVVLAMDLGVPFITADERLVSNKVLERRLRLVHVREYPSIRGEILGGSP